MPHDTPLIATIVVGLCLAFVFGAIAQRLRISPLVGYLLAGVALGPYTPGFVADQSLASELAEIGVILLMFGVGLHFSLKDLWSVRLIAVPGAIVQIAVATMFGIGLGYSLGWPIGAGITFGLALSVASTVVLLRALQERRILNTERGRIAVGWLIVEDLVMVLTLVLLPALVPILNGSLQDAAGSSGFEVAEIATTLAITIAKVAAFVVVMLVIGRRVIPWILHYVAHSGSRELFRLAVLSIALGCAYGAAQLFGVSFALGAFFAGMILSESALSQQAASETLPLRDAFAVLFFISVGMLFDPAILVRDPLLVLATVAIIVIAKSVAALAIVQLFGRPLGTAATIAVSLAQIGEFSFILAGLGVSLGLMPQLGRELILAGAIISIVLNPLLFMALDRLRPWLDARDGAKAVADAVAADKALNAAGSRAGDRGDEPAGAYRPRRLRQHRPLDRRGAVERRRAAVRHRGKGRRGRQAEGARHRGRRRQCASRARRRQSCPGARAARCRAGSVRGRADRGAGARRQSRSLHRGARALGHRGGVPVELRCERRCAGRARDRRRDGGAAAAGFCHAGAAGQLTDCSRVHTSVDFALQQRDGIAVVA